MKYKTFRALLIAGGVASVLGGCGLLSWWCGTVLKAPAADTRRPAAAGPPPVPSSTPPSGASPPPNRGAVPASPGAEIALRPMDQEILRRADQRISGDKVKDAFPGRPYKVNLYQDPGEPRINRLKIDLDRDEKWDEKWTFSRNREEVKRQVSPADDDTNYPEEYLLRGTVWVRR